MVRIGTRAVISFEGKPMLATHWDGYPASLGRGLLNCDKSIEAVIEIAKAHTIDSADASLLETLNAERVTHLAEISNNISRLKTELLLSITDNDPITSLYQAS